MISKQLARPLSGRASSAWTCPACQTRSLVLLPRASSALSPSAREAAATTPSPRTSRFAFNAQQRRTILSVPALSYDETFTRDGVPGLFSKTGFRIAWTVYQRMMVDKLNEQLAGEPTEGNDVKQLVLKFGRDPMNASLFNHASMAWNNHAFFNALSTSPSPLENQPALRDSLIETFGSIETLRATMIDTAQAMFGPGFVWLVWAYDAPVPAGATLGGSRLGDWRILTTYLAGTPFPEAGQRQQGELPSNFVGSVGPHTRNGRERATVPPGSTKIIPALCVNTWEHVYIYDFGLPGKRKYLSDWWDAVDWSWVEMNVPRQIWQRM